MTDTATKPWPAMSIAEATRLLTAPGTRLEMETVNIRGVTTRVRKNCPPSNREVFLAGRTFADREFLVYEDDRCTYETFARATLKLAAQLQRDGIEKGDRVAIIMRNLPEWPVAFYGAAIAALAASTCKTEVTYFFIIFPPLKARNFLPVTTPRPTIIPAWITLRRLNVCST